MREWYLENEKFEALEKQNGDCVVKDKERNKFYFQKKYFISQKYEFHNKEQIHWNWVDNVLILGITLSIASLILVIYHFNEIYNSDERFMLTEYILSTIFIGFNIAIHEFAHYFVMKLYGRKAEKIKIKVYLKIFPCIITNTSDSYILPQYRRGFIYYAGIMMNWITCGFVLAFSPEYSYLLRSIVWMAIYNMIPFGGIKTDGYHIIVNTLFDIRDFKRKRNFVSEIAKYAFVIFALISFYQSVVIMFGK